MYEITAMQAACWVNGHAKDEGSAEPSAHLYVELDSREGQALIDADRLARAVLALLQRHNHLRLTFDDQGVPSIADLSSQHRLYFNDLRDLDPAGCEEKLRHIRASKTHQRLALRDGVACEFTLSQLPGGKHRLHIDLDMIASDPSCFPYVMADLAVLYELDAKALDRAAGDFVKHRQAYRADPARSHQEAIARTWWKDQIADLPPAPNLPAPEHPQTHDTAQSTRFAATLTDAETAAFLKYARAIRATPSSLALSLFAKELGHATGQSALRLTVPMFEPQNMSEQGPTIGDFSNFTLMGVDHIDATLDVLTEHVQTRLVQAISHSARPGPQLMRDLARHLGSVPSAPVVFTAGFDHPLGSILPDLARNLFGDLVWSVSQGPGVALDAQIAKLGDQILINWDIRLDLVDEQWIKALFDRFVTRLRTLQQDVDNIDHSKPLSQLQCAYILGRKTTLPLGGVAMQEVRLFRGTFDLERLQDRLDVLCTQHPALRTRINERDQRMYYVPKDTAPLDLYDLSDDQNAPEQLAAFWDSFKNELCALDGPLWQVCAVKMPAGQEDAVAVRFDALALDGPAIAKICADMFVSKPMIEEPAQISEPPVSAAQRNVDAAYWAQALQDIDAGPNLPWVTPLHQIRTSRYRRESQRITAQQRRELQRAAAKSKLFLNSLLSSVVLEILARFTPDMRLYVGLPTAPALDNADLGNRASFIVVDHDAGISTPAERAAVLQSKTMAGLSHMEHSGVDLARQLLSQTKEALALPIVLTNGLNWARPDPDVSMYEVAGQTQTPQVALDIRLMNGSDGGIEIAADYAESALEADTVHAMLMAITAALKNIYDLGSLDLPTPLVASASPEQYPNVTNLDPYLLKIADNLRAGQGTALIQGTTHISYGALRDKIEAILGWFAQNGIHSGAVLAIHLPRGIDHIALQLAAALSGVIWVPLDVSAPVERRDYQLARCAPSLVVSQDDIDLWRCIKPDLLLNADRQDLPEDTVLSERSLNRDAGYYLFTSGTTGAPKCVVLNNRATSNVLDQTLHAWNVSPKDVVMSVTPLHHDMSVFDIFGTLSAGATLVMPDLGQDKDAMEWAQIVARHNVTLWVSVPAILEMLLDSARPEQLGSLRLIAQGGDYIKPAQIALLRDICARAKLVSLGGPTETTIWSIWHDIGSETGAVPYGRALKGAEYLICNPAGEPCPTGVVGRIHTAGDCLSLGYLDDGNLVSTGFVSLPDHNGNPRRAFRTGDLGKWAPDGTITFAGRVGGYVKVRGVRVSLGDIESTLGQHESLRQSMVVDLVSDDGRDTSLAALCVSHENTQPSTADLRKYMREKLPQSHLPDRFIFVPSLPLSANGKPDKAAARRLAEKTSTMPPAPKPNASDQQLTTQVLNIYLEHLGAHGDADSILLDLGLMPNHLAPIATALNSRLGCKLNPMQLIRARTARQAAAIVAQQPVLSAT